MSIFPFEFWSRMCNSPILHLFRVMTKQKQILKTRERRQNSQLLCPIIMWAHDSKLFHIRRHLRFSVVDWISACTPLITKPQYFLGHKEHYLLIPIIRKLSPLLWNQTSSICMVNATFIFSLVPFTVDDKLWRDFWIFLQGKFFHSFQRKVFYRLKS